MSQLQQPGSFDAKDFLSAVAKREEKVPAFEKRSPDAASRRHQ